MPWKAAKPAIPPREPGIQRSINDRCPDPPALDFGVPSWTTAPPSRGKPNMPRLPATVASWRSWSRPFQMRWLINVASRVINASGPTLPPPTRLRLAPRITCPSLRRGAVSGWRSSWMVSGSSGSRVAGPRRWSSASATPTPPQTPIDQSSGIWRSRPSSTGSPQSIRVSQAITPMVRATAAPLIAPVSRAIRRS